MIEREATVKICSELLANLLGGAKAANGRLVRVAEDGYYEVHPRRSRAAATRPSCPIGATVIIATKPESDGPAIEVER